MIQAIASGRPSAGILLETILEEALRAGATDIHVRAEMAPMFRVNGAVSPQSALVPSLDDIELFLSRTLKAEQRATLAERLSLNVGFNFQGEHRFRINISRSMGDPLLVFRRIQKGIPDFEALRLPSAVREFSKLKNGLVLIAGKAGSGKSTTLASIAEHINISQAKHIVTIEDPIEYIIASRKSIVTQKELGTDVVDYSSAAREVLRQDPDIIIIGEIRDPLTAQFALNAAETGHLVFSTLHSVDTVETVNRLLSLFDHHQQTQVRLQLASVLRAVVSQKLVPHQSEGKMVPVFEIMMLTERIKKLIQSPSETGQIASLIEDGHVTYGMQSFDQNLLQLVGKGEIAMETAIAHATRPGNFELIRQGIQSIALEQWGDSLERPAELPGDTAEPDDDVISGAFPPLVPETPPPVAWRMSGKRPYGSPRLDLGDREPQTVGYRSFQSRSASFVRAEPRFPWHELRRYGADRLQRLLQSLLPNPVARPRLDTDMDTDMETRRRPTLFVLIVTVAIAFCFVSLLVKALAE